MRKTRLLIGTVAALLATSQPAFAQSCSGACEALTISKSNGCVVLRNSSDYRIRVKQTGEIFGSPAYTFDVYARSEIRPMAGGLGGATGCLRNFDHNYIVEYVGGGPPRPTPAPSPSPAPTPASPQPPRERGCPGGRFCGGAPATPTVASNVLVTVINSAPRSIYVKFRKFVTGEDKWVSTEWYAIESQNNRSIDLKTRHPVSYITVFDESGCITTESDEKTVERDVSSPIDDENYEASFMRLPEPRGNAIIYWLARCPNDGPPPSRLRRVPTNP